MEAYICDTCGVQYEASHVPPAHCKICEDERQYVNPSGQTWTTLKLINAQHENTIETVGPGVFAIYTTPKFGIGQRAHLVQSAGEIYCGIVLQTSMNIPLIE